MLIINDQCPYLVKKKKHNKNFTEESVFDDIEIKNVKIFAFAVCDFYT